MIVDGKDHDMVVVAYAFHLYHYQVSEHAAYGAAGGHPEDFAPLDAFELAHLLCDGGLDAEAVVGDPRTVWQHACQAASEGRVTLVRAGVPGVTDAPLWCFLQGHRGPFTVVTTMLGDEVPIEQGKPISRSFTGQAVIVPVSVPGWAGDWTPYLRC